MSDKTPGAVTMASAFNMMRPLGQEPCQEELGEKIPPNYLTPEWDEKLDEQFADVFEDEAEEPSWHDREGRD